MAKAVAPAKLTKAKLQDYLRIEYHLMKPVSSQMTSDQIRSLYTALQDDPDLKGAIQIIIHERNEKARGNSRLGSEKSGLNSKLETAVKEKSSLNGKLETAVKDLSYVKRQLDDYKIHWSRMLRNLLRLDRSEIYSAIKELLALLSKEESGRRNAS